MGFKVMFIALKCQVLKFSSFDQKANYNLTVTLFTLASIIFTPQPLRAVGVLFSPIVSGWAGGRASGRREIVCPGCISETVRCRKLILGRDIG